MSPLTQQRPQTCQPRQEAREGRPTRTSLTGPVACLVALLSMVACSKSRTADATSDEPHTVSAPSVATSDKPRTVSAPSVAASADAVRGDASLNGAAQPAKSRLSEAERKLEFRWTEHRGDNPCWPWDDHPDARPDCASAKYVEGLMARKGEVELVGRPRCSEPGCQERPDLILGYSYPNNAIFLLTPEGARFPDICYDPAEVGRRIGRLRVRGRFDSRRAAFVDDEVLWPGDWGPCDEDPHPVFLVRAWCIDRGTGKPPEFVEDGSQVPAKHICGTPQPF